MSITCKVETITPEVAEKMMGRNTGNFRKLDKARVQMYSRDIAAGLWDLNGETIVFGDDGQLKNGQHRLAGVIKACRAIQSVVVRGITCEATHIDRGKPRSVAQWIAHSGVKNAGLVAAISRLCVGYTKGIWRKKGWGVSEMTDNEVLAFADTHHDAINASSIGARPAGVSRSHFVSVMFIGCGFRDINRSDEAIWFRDAIVDGIDLSELDAVCHFRNRLAKSGHAKLTAFMVRMLLTLAWNKTAEKTECSANGMRLRLVGSKKQELPNEIVQVDDI